MNSGAQPDPDRRPKLGWRLPLSALFPLAAFGLEWTFWEALRPNAWFMFYPAVFFSSLVGGRWMGLAATAFSALAVWWSFIPPYHSFLLARPGNAISIAVFAGMGALMSVINDRLRQANVKVAEGLESVQAAKANLEARISQRTGELTRTLEALRESEEQFRTLANTMPNLAWWANGDGFITWYNRRWYEYTGTTPEQMEGWGWQSVHDPAMLDQVMAQWSRAIATGEVFDMEFPLRAADGSFRTFLTRTHPVKDGNGRVLRWLGTNTDISGQKQAQEAIARNNEVLEERVRERTTQLEKLNKELETFTYSVSHDLKAPLRGIDGYSQLLQTDYAGRLDDDGRMFLRKVRAGVAQMHELIEDLLSYSRMERCALQSVCFDLAALVQVVVAERQPEIEGTGVQLRNEVAPLMVRADREGLAIVLRNLLENAIKFSRNALPPTVAIGARAEGNLALLWVRDNGIGFDMQFHDRIFEMFQRLQRAEDYPGTGIGLALVFKAMQRMGGQAWAESAPGQGATFFLEIPL